MPRLPRRKVQLCIYLHEEVAEALRKRVIAKYGRVRNLSREVEEAVRAWIGGPHEGSKTPPPPARGRALVDESRLVVCPICRRLGLLRVIGGAGERPEVYVLHVREGKEVRCDLSLL